MSQLVIDGRIDVSHSVVLCFIGYLLYGQPLAFREDNGPELVSGTLLSWAEKRGKAIQHIQPSKPQQNAYIERYNRTIRHEWLE